ncbi:MAG: hypothetical protein KUG77_22330 [Nannocystaceae bacterium]|nr:hypothetical protein [Nannocystaceae bacterium]
MLGLRIGMGGAALAVLGSGVFLSGKLERNSRMRVADYAAAAPVEADDADVRTKGNPDDDRAFDEQAFDKGVLADAAAFGLPAEGVVDAVHGAQAYAVELEQSTVLAPNRSWSSPHLKITAVLDKVAYQKHGATVSARHSIALVENISQTPVAYRLRLTSDARGRCEVHGARQHNAMALMPGEKAEIVVCAGGGKIRVQRVEILEISALGHRYLSRVPPRAVSVDSLSAYAHAPVAGTKPCETVDVSGVSLSLREGTVGWADVVDFYSRHSCDRFRYFHEYRHQGGAPEKLPAKPAAG